MKHIASWSGGKDSTASIILAHEHNEPLDLIIFSEVMYDENISGELPEHIDFIKNKAIPVFESWGFETKILHSDRNYMDCFQHRTVRGKNIGMKKGFVMSGHCDVQRDCKLRPIKRFLSEQKDFVQYIGIAINEPKRMNRIVNAGDKVSLLEKYGYTERMAFDLCRKYDLLSPIYEFAPRGGLLVLPECQIRRTETSANTPPGFMEQTSKTGKGARFNREYVEYAYENQNPRMGRTILLGGSADEYF